MDSLRNKIGLGIFALSVLACSESSNSIPPDFVRLYVDLRVASREYGETSTDGRIVRMRILEKYGYTAERFDSVAECIQKSPDLWEPKKKKKKENTESIAVAVKAAAPQIRDQPDSKKKKKK